MLLYIFLKFQILRGFTKSKMKHMLKNSAFYLIGNPKRVACWHPYLRKLLPFKIFFSLFHKKRFNFAFLKNRYRKRIRLIYFLEWRWTLTWFSPLSSVMPKVSRMSEKFLERLEKKSSSFPKSKIFKVKLVIKVHIFWEGHKILRNLQLTFVCMYFRQK